MKQQVSGRLGCFASTLLALQFALAVCLLTVISFQEMTGGPPSIGSASFRSVLLAHLVCSLTIAAPIGIWKQRSWGYFLETSLLVAALIPMLRAVVGSDGEFVPVTAALFAVGILVARASLVRGCALRREAALPSTSSGPMQELPRRRAT